ncbi:hypothetical protein C1N83_27960 (plasmid) [Priestia aryabhattai]
MQKIVWNDTNSQIIIRTPVWNHIKTLEECADTLVNQTLDNNYKKLSFDYNIEVIELRNYSFEQLNYWIRLNIFLKYNPNHTFSLMTLRCSKFETFPVILDVNYSDETSFLFCNTEEEFQAQLYGLCNKGFLKMSYSLQRHIPYSDLQTVAVYSKILKEKVVKDKIHQVELVKKYNKPWSDEQNSIFEDIMDQYRSSIVNKDAQQIKRITNDYSFEMKKKYENLLINRSERSIYEHLAYFDDLLAGVGHPDDYAKKDYKYFGSKNRFDGNKETNPARIWRRRPNNK